MLALLSLGGMAAKAQSFEFQYQGQSLKDGATVTIAAEADAFGDLSCETNASSDPTNGLMLKLLSVPTANVKAVMEITYNTLSPQMLQWCMGGNCTPFDNVSMLNKQLAVNGEEQVQFDAINISSKGYLLATLKASVGLESHQVVIQFTNGESAGIRELTTQSQAPTIYSLRGTRVKTPASKGIYIVSDGNRERKVLLK